MQRTYIAIFVDQNATPVGERMGQEKKSNMFDLYNSNKLELPQAIIRTILFTRSSHVFTKDRCNKSITAQIAVISENLYQVKLLT